jgi:HEAT repeat protein
MFSLVEEASAGRLVQALGNEPRAPAAYRELLNRGPAAVPVIRAGLQHPDPVVRESCCKLLDRLLVPEAVGELLARLGDANAGVRCAALHALACDRCKPDRCRPVDPAVLAAGLRLLQQDEDHHVRNFAVELVGRFAHGDPAASAALTRARDTDPSPAVRKKAGWYAPGGTIYRRTTPRKPTRKR